MKRRCNGYVSPTPELSARARDLISAKIFRARVLLTKLFGGINDEKQLYCEHRFNDDESVMARISSAYKDEEITPKTVGRILIDALYDCASADYYYAFEKDWGYE